MAHRRPVAFASVGRCARLVVEVPRRNTRLAWGQNHPGAMVKTGGRWYWPLAPVRRTVSNRFGCKPAHFVRVSGPADTPRSADFRLSL